MISEVRIAATFDMYVNARGSNSPLHSVFIEKYFAGTSASRGKASGNTKTDLQKKPIERERKISPSLGMQYNIFKFLNNCEQSWNASRYPIKGLKRRVYKIL